MLFVHHVFFWLKNPGNQVDKAALIKGLEELTTLPTIKTYHIGTPAPTDRAVIDSSYSVSWLLIFDSIEDEASYQNDPIHHAFVDKCKHLWARVVVYDSI